jgi:hypothetical protein
MTLTPDQHSLIASAYEKAASDTMVPPQLRTAFARKAEWFRMLARLGAKPKLTAMLAKDSPQQMPQRASEKKNPDASPSPLSSAARHLFAWQQRR